MAPRPLVIAFHLVWTGYGWWLPNDPRGSGSTVVRCGWLSDLGPVHLGRKRVQPKRREVRAFHDEAAVRLKHPLLKFGDAEIALIANAFADVIRTRRYTCYACAVMPDHAHLVIRKHRDTAEDMLANLQETSRAAVIGSGFCDDDHPVWVNGGWRGYLDSPREVWSRIRYVGRNPRKDGLPDQCWPFVVEYDNWPLHPGHNPNSPWAQRLRAWEEEQARLEFQQLLDSRIDDDHD